MSHPWRWLRPRGQKLSGWFLAWNVLLRVLFPVEAFGAGIIPGTNPKHNLYRQRQNPVAPQLQPWQNSLWDYHLPIEISSSLVQTSPILQQPRTSFSLPKTPYFPRMNKPSYHRPGWGTIIKKKQDMMEICDGKGNLLQDLGVLAIVSGAVGTLMGIFSASYYSVVGNTISIISGFLSYMTGIPSAIITYLAASDRISYTVANILSLLSLANTAYGLWSVDFGNKDILTSQIANIIGVFSLVLSIVTAFPELFDAIVHDFIKKNPDKRREVYGFVRNYGCSGGSPTFYEILEDLLRQLARL